MSLYTAVVRPLLFCLDSETAHYLTVETCRLAGAVPGVPQMTRRWLEFTAPELETEFAGLRLASPLGLAAGWDTSGRALRMLDALGFGFTEIGSVSARPSRGNPKPRLFRLPQDRALIVNYGLPNDGAEMVAQRLAAHRSLHPLGVNIVSTNDGPAALTGGDDDILADYECSAALLHRGADFLSLDLSCPNAKGGKDFFATPGSITRLLERLEPLRIACPVFLKITPRDNDDEHVRVLTECDAFPFVRGFCFNLPPGRPDTLQFTTPRDKFAHQPGAVAVRPVAPLINRCIAGLYQQIDRRRYVNIGTGGVSIAEDAYAKIRLGASVVQIFTAMIYEGSGIAGRIGRGLVDLLQRDGFRHLSEAVGTAHRESFRP